MKNGIIRTAFFAILVLLLGLQSCKEKENLLIGLCMDSFVSERWEKDRAFFVERVKELGGDVLVEAAQGDEKIQYEQAKKMIEKGISVLVIVAVNRDAAANIVDLANKNKVKVLAYDRMIRKANLDYYISFDNINVGELQADYLTKRKPQGNYVIISGPAMDNNSFLFKLGQMNILQPLIENGDVKIVYDEFSKAWIEDEGAFHTEQAIKNTQGNIDVIIAANDNLASGAIRALEKHDMVGKVLVCGQDAQLEACRNIVAGKQTITIYKPLKLIATTAAEAVIRMAKNEPLPNANVRMNNGRKMVNSILLSSMVVNQSNIRQTVIEDGFHSEEDIFQH